MLLQRRIERYTGSAATATEDVAIGEEARSHEPVIDELEFEDGGFHKLLLDEPKPKEDPIAVVIPDDEPLEGPLSPELVLVLPPQLAELAREQLPEPEPLDEWLARMRREDRAREWESLVAAIQAHEHEVTHGGVAGFVFAALMVVLSVVPALVLLLV